MFPPYYPNADFEGLARYYKAIGEAVDLGLFLYSRDTVNLSPSQVFRLASEIPNLIALKEGQGDIRNYQRVMERCGDKLHWIGGIGDDMVPGLLLHRRAHLHLEHCHDCPSTLAATARACFDA